MTMEQHTPQQQFDLALALARLEGKLDGALMQQGRHDSEITGLKADAQVLRDRIVVLETQQATTRDAKRSAPGWPAVLSAVVAAVALVLVIAQAIYGG